MTKLTKEAIDSLKIKIKSAGESVAIGEVKSVSVGVPIDLDSVYSIDTSGSHPVIGTLSSDGSWTISGTVTVSSGTFVSSAIIMPTVGYTAHSWAPDREALDLVSVFVKRK